ncbi:MAG: tyrosine-protein kinase [Gaiellaceae bacterium]|nr:tyrosine-protein kinase [Gaiellaceae bacterium]
MQTHDNSGSTLSEYLRVFRRRKWIVFATAALIPLAAVAFSLRQHPLYEASAEVFVSRNNLANTLAGTQDPSALGDPAHLMQTQANLAQVAAVRRRALDAVGLQQRSVIDFGKASDVTPQTDADLIDFNVRDRSPTLAAQLATAYARQFTIYRRQLDTNALKRSEAQLERTLSDLRASGGEKSGTYTSLAEKLQQLRTLEALQTSNTSVVENAGPAVKVQPRPVRNAILGLGLGLLAGIGLAFLFEALDTRLRSAAEVTKELEMPLLARIPASSRRFRRERRLEVLEEPHSPVGEAFRILRTNLDFANFELHARSVMVTSALEGEGKSTTVGNLAVSLALAGRRVVLVDLDLRRPTIASFFDLEDRAGVVDVVLGSVELKDALVRVPVRASAEPPPPATNGRADALGVLEVLPAGRVPPNPGDFIESRRLTELIEGLRAHGDIVLIDAPPLLNLNDALALSAKVDALLLVRGMHILRRSTLNELRRVLDASPAAKLGIVSIGLDAEEVAGYGYGYGERYLTDAATAVSAKRRSLRRRRTRV